MNSFIVGFIVSCIGLAYFRYGKNTNHPLFLMDGLLMMIIPMFISTWTYLIVFSIVTIILPFVLKI